MATTRSINFILVGFGINCSWVGIVTTLRTFQLNNFCSMLDRGNIFLSFRKPQHGGWVVHPTLSN
jgi:hypothetical protein